VTVRSESLAHAADAVLGPRTTVIYTNPPGRTAIVKDLCLTQILGLNSVQLVYINRGGVLAWAAWETFAASGVIRLERWVVLQPGDTLNWSRTVAAGGSCHVHISGAELAG